MVASPSGTVPAHHASYRRTHPRLAPPRMQLQAIFSADGRDWFSDQRFPRSQISDRSQPGISAFGGRGYAKFADSRHRPDQRRPRPGARASVAQGVSAAAYLRHGLVRRSSRQTASFAMLHRVPNQLTWTTISPGTAFELGGANRLYPDRIARSPPYYAREFDASNCRRGERRSCSSNQMAYVSPTPRRFPRSRRSCFDL